MSDIFKNLFRTLSFKNGDYDVNVSVMSVLCHSETSPCYYQSVTIPQIGPLIIGIPMTNGHLVRYSC